MDTNPLVALVEALDALAVAGGDRPVGSLAPGELVAVNAAVGVLRRRVDAVGVQVAAEIARLSRTGLGKDSLARRHGFRSAEAMISATTGVPVFEARRMMQVGEATAPRVTVSGEPAPQKYPHVAAGVREGRIGTTAAAAILAMLNRVSPRAGQAGVAEMEEHLATAAAGMRPDELARLLTQAEAVLDPGGVERKQAEIFADRSLTISERDGVLRVEYRSDVLSGAPVKAAIESIVSATLHHPTRTHDHTTETSPTGGNDTGGHGARKGGSCDGGACDGGAACPGHDGRHDDACEGCAGGARVGEAEADQRSIRQIRADALTELCRHALGCENAPTTPTVTVVVRMNLTDLQTGIGQATIDGIDQPVTAGQVRRLAADLELIPLVLGTRSEILDLGRTARLFTPKQKLAITERDHGCISCGAPPPAATSTT